MNSANAVGFLTVGALMAMLPHLFPGWFPADGLDGNSGSALWVQAMGLAQTVLGFSYLMKRCAVMPLLRWNAARPLADKRQGVMLPGARGVDLR